MIKPDLVFYKNFAHGKQTKDEKSKKNLVRIIIGSSSLSVSPYGDWYVSYETGIAIKREAAVRSFSTK